MAALLGGSTAVGVPTSKPPEIHDTSEFPSLGQTKPSSAALTAAVPTPAGHAEKTHPPASPQRAHANSAAQNTQFVASKDAALTNDRWGLLGLLGVIRMTDADLNTLALGCDLTALGLDLNANK